MTIKNIVSRALRRAAIVSPLLIVVFASRIVRASPRPLPFTYPYEQLGKGEAELELYTDVDPLRVLASPADPSQGRLWEPYYQLQSELEYGIDDRWELGFYQVFEANPLDGGGNSMKFDGLKWRIRTRIAEPGELPVDIALYLELETLADEWALEEKVILQRRFGALRLMSNLWVEQELERPFDGAPSGQSKRVGFVINPTLGATYQITPTFHLGAEYWARGQFVPEGDDPIERRNTSVHHFIGPVVHVNFGSFWWTSGLYAHLNDMTKPQPGEAYGPWWFRSVLGIDL